MIRTLILTAAVMAGLTTSTSTAQAQGGFGIGFGGRGVGVYVGRGGGWGGYYGPSGYYGPGYYGGPRVYTGSGYYGPSYYGGAYSSSPYYGPGQVDSGSTVVTPAVPDSAVPFLDGGTIVLMNPVANQDAIEYALNGEHFLLRPGQSQRIAHDRNWIIEFGRGDGSNFARYSLKPTTYKFKPAANGWELFEQANSRPDVGALPPLPTPPLPAQTSNRARSNGALSPVPEAVGPKPRDLSEPAYNPETVIQPRTVTQPETSNK